VPEPPAYARISAAKRRLRLVSQRSTASPALPHALAETEEQLRQALAELQAASLEIEAEAEALAAATVAAGDDAASWRSVFQEAPEPILVSDGEATIRWANAAAGEVLGKRAEYLVGKPLVVFVADGERQAFIRRLTRLKAGGATRISAWPILLCARDRSPFSGEASVSLAREPDARVAKMVWMIRDVSAHRRTEERLLFLGTHDPTTGLYTQAYFEEEIARLARGRRFPVSMLVARVAGLPDTALHSGEKWANDLLRRAASTLRTVLRREDVFARIRPGTFAALLPATGVRAAAKLLVHAMKATAMDGDGDQTTVPNVSLGVATAAGGDALPEALHLAETRASRAPRRHTARPRPTE
jgi:PAS domain S-box-containing protein